VPSAMEPMLVSTFQVPSADAGAGIELRDAAGKLGAPTGGGPEGRKKRYQMP